MNKDELKARLSELLPATGQAAALAQDPAAQDPALALAPASAPAPAFEEGGEWVTVVVDPAGWEGLVRAIRSAEGLEFDYLFCVTAVDWKTHITMVYHLTSTVHRHTVVVKVKLDHERPVIRTVSDIWRTAEFHEREAYDLFGVVFTGHPDLRRLFMTDEWKGWPLRKDYEDPVNMIKL